LSIRDLKGILGDVRDIVTAPTINVMLILGFLLVLFAFVRLDGLRNLSFVKAPNWIMLIIGLGLLISGLIIFPLTREDRRINKKATIQKGISFSFQSLSVNLKVGKIQEISQLSKDCAVVLPANTTFIDDCITDEKSALGSFFLKHHPDKIQEVPEDIKKHLTRSGYPRAENGTYPLGTTIILPKKYDTPAKIIMTASTIRKEISGIRAEPSSLCECIRQIFMVTSDKKLSKLYMPILGSGHGGLDINAALLFLLLSIRHYAHQYHHIKSVNIIVTENDTTRLKDIYRLQYLTLLEEARK